MIKLRYSTHISELFCFYVLNHILSLNYYLQRIQNFKYQFINLRLDKALSKMISDAKTSISGESDFTVVIPPRTSFRLTSGKNYRNPIHLHDLQITIIASDSKKKESLALNR